MKRFEVRYKLEGENAYRVIRLDLPDIECALKSGYVSAKGMHKIPVVEINVRFLRCVE